LTHTEYAIIVAGGKGSRIKSKLPKQFLPLNGKPLLLHTLEAFYRYSEKIIVVLVLPQENIPSWDQIAKEYNFKKPVIVQPGGQSRFQSVKRGLEKISGDGLVAIHDGVRPLVNSSIIRTSFQLAAVHDAAAAAVPLKDSIRIVEGKTSLTPMNHTRAVDRSKFWLVQTPQTFKVSVIRDAYGREEDTALTDDASVAEQAGINITLFEGSYHNIKITTSDDLIIAEALLRQAAKL
jgi:2-C-methyl-D-erythritol 4-phosphate cytidylyltransferase